MGAAADHIAAWEAAHLIDAETAGRLRALLAEGLILVGAGVAADRLRRRIGRRGDQQSEEPGPGAAEPLPAAPR
jgi:hypothetical protein